VGPKVLGAGEKLKRPLNDVVASVESVHVAGPRQVPDAVGTEVAAMSDAVPNAKSIPPAVTPVPPSVGVVKFKPEVVLLPGLPQRVTVAETGPLTLNWLAV